MLTDVNIQVQFHDVLISQYVEVSGSLFYYGDVVITSDKQEWTVFNICFISKIDMWQLDPEGLNGK